MTRKQHAIDEHLDAEGSPQTSDTEQQDYEAKSASELLKERLLEDERIEIYGG